MVVLPGIAFNTVDTDLDKISFEHMIFISDAPFNKQTKAAPFYLFLFKYSSSSSRECGKVETFISASDFKGKTHLKTAWKILKSTVKNL